ncbi:cytochrome P450 [Melanomma pulvis-pyrius CBS 109.77]|uniref:Cytochrome P450 n=1 Tax=Melanomma pulvis-pyrius CBS 109.77 TaxID=1314802 RepID=A0A6A6XJB9_9PLEO|nr:cytochrome P450 [Melanomma pulvis-pyrius CBS 109.77]
MIKYTLTPFVLLAVVLGSWSSLASGQPFIIHTPSNDHILVSQPHHISELTSAPLNQLSLHAVAKETQLLQTNHTMPGFALHDQRNVDGIGFVRTLGTLLTSHLDYFLPTMRLNIERSLEDSFARAAKSDGSSLVPIYPAMKRLTVRVNAVIFFGEELVSMPKFTGALLKFPQEVYITAELLRSAPRFLAPVMTYLATRNHKTCKTLFRILTPVVTNQLRLSQNGATDQEIEWLIDTVPQKEPWTVERIIWEIVAVWFSSVHQLAMAKSGDWVCVPQGAMNRDSQHYSNPDEFNPFRFVGSSRLTDAKYPWMLWGLSRAVCPGRFYTSAVLKVLLTHILVKFDVSLENPEAKRSFSWRTAIVPRGSTRVLFRRKE